MAKTRYIVVAQEEPGDYTEFRFSNYTEAKEFYEANQDEYYKIYEPEEA